MGQETTGTEFDEDLAASTTTTTRRGRGKSASGGRRVTQVTKREFIEPADDQEDELERNSLPGMFALADVEEHSIVRIRVIRRDPDEGMLGYIDDPNASEEEIERRWGGSLYQIFGLDKMGKVRATRSMRIAGDPIFVSESARLDWERRRGIKRTEPAHDNGMSLRETLAFMRQMDEDRAKAAEIQRAREAQERREHEERMRKLELEAEERRRKDEIEREDRRRRELAEAEQRQRQHLDMMMTIMKQSADQAITAVKQQQTGGGSGAIMDAVKMVVAIKEAFGGEGGGAGEPDTDPLNLLIKHGPEWLNGLGSAVTGAIREVKGGGVAGQQQVVGQTTAPQLSAAANPDVLAIPRSSPLAGKLEKIAGTIAQRGQDPEKVLAVVIDNLQATLEGQPPPHTPQTTAAATPAPAAAPAATPAETPVPAPTAPAGSPVKVSAEKTARGSTKISFG